jgi:predicted Zn finger-like uncharacterized protein
MTTVRCPNCQATYNVDAAKLADGGRKLRCAKCQTVWLAKAEVVEPEVVPTEVAVEVAGAASGAADEVGAPAGGPETLAGEAVTTHSEGDSEGDVAFAPPSEEMLVQRTPGVEVMAQAGGWRRLVRGDNVWRSGAVAFVCVGILLGCGVFWWTFFMGGEVRGHKMVEVVAPVVQVSAVVQPPKGLVLHRVRSEVKDVEGEGGGVALTVRGLLANTTSNTLNVPAMRLELLGKDGAVADMWPVSGIAGTLQPKGEQAWVVSLTAPDMASIQGWRVVFVSETSAGVTPVPQQDDEPVEPEAEPAHDEPLAH